MDEPMLLAEMPDTEAQSDAPDPVASELPDSEAQEVIQAIEPIFKKNM